MISLSSLFFYDKKINERIIYEPIVRACILNIKKIDHFNNLFTNAYQFFNDALTMLYQNFNSERR